MVELNKIYCEDCLVTLSKIDDESVDLVVTSPPYNKNIYAPASGSDKTWSALRGRQIAYDKYDDAMKPEEYEAWQRKVIDECLRVLKPTGSIFYNHKDILVNGLVVAPKFIYDYNLHQQIIWNRGSSLANDPHYFQPITEYVYWIVKDAKRFYFNKDKAYMRQSVWNVNFELNTEHPAPFPLKLVKNCVITCTPPMGLVYDPFMGSGTTALATIQCGDGRQYIGSEISEKYCQIAQRRINAETSQLNLF
ncbi:MAG: site-specific DNA-methyltransferase [Bacteroidales bacterium]|nr:site-specific DNA-methyltransferase [Bacteroidales bacterium]